MNSPVSFTLRTLFAGAVFSVAAAAQTPSGPRVDFPAASPASTLKQKVGFTDIEIVYSRPGVKERKIFPDFLPYGEVWRTGANSATKVTFSTAVKIDGKELPAGSYALYSIPGASEWTVIFNKVTGEWGAYAYKQENDALRVKAKAVKLAQSVETFTIDINDIRTQSATLNLVWENTRVPVKFEVDVVKSVVAQIDAAMASGQPVSAGVYYNSAMFFFDHGLDLKKARAWVMEATKGDKPQFFMLHGKAKILAKLGEKEAAIAAAKASIAAAEGAAKAEYLRLNGKLIASLR